MPRTIKIRIKNAAYPLLMRTGRSSDREVLHQIFIDADYGSIMLSHEPVIVDLGANVGYSSSYFLSKYPSATLIALEPDIQNFHVCCLNLKPFGQRARVVQGAAWPEAAKLVVQRNSFGDGREWATQVHAPSASNRTDEYVQGYDMNSVLNLSGRAEIDLVKIDIEGSERELFSRNTDSWLPRVKNLCIELHDPECERIFFSVLASYPYESFRSGDLMICHNLRKRPD